MNITKGLKKIFKLLGYDLMRLNAGLNYGSIENELIKLLKNLEVDLILDIGANKGQFGSTMISYGYTNKLLSFEPISFMHEKLQKESSNYPNWHVYEPSCIGDSEKTVTINISNLVGNSSLLNIKSTNYNVNQSHYVDKEDVKQIELATLNDFPLVKASKNIFLKMDVQGYEHVILNGLPKTDYNIIGFYIELSLVKLYEEQEDYLYICNQLKSLGYDLVYIAPESIRSNRMIQFNGIFLHNSISYTS